MRKSAIVSLLVLTLVISGCGKTEASASSPKGVSAQLTATKCDPSRPGATCTGPNSAAAAAAVTKIVFVGKEHACDCTRARVDAAWAVLQKALGATPKVPVERLQIDTEGDKVAPYRQQRALMALPAIYFLNAKGEVVELLQGEVTAEQVAKALGATAAAK
jgi:hypothetical protein